MRKAIVRFVQRVLAPLQPEESFETDFDSVSQMVDAARALRSHGCKVRHGDAALRIVVTLPKFHRVSVCLKTAGGVR